MRDPRQYFIKDRATYSQGIPRPGTCTFDMLASSDEIFVVMGKAPAPYMKRTNQGFFIELQPQEIHHPIDAGAGCKGIGTPEEEFMEVDHLQMVNFGVGFHLPRVANREDPSEIAINLQLILHEPGEPLPFVIVEMYRYKDNSANIQIETLSGIVYQAPVTTHGAFVEFRNDQRGNRFRILVDDEEHYSPSYKTKISPRVAVGVRAGTSITIADSARIMLVTAPEQFSFKVPDPWRSICQRPWALPDFPADSTPATLSMGTGPLFGRVEDTTVRVTERDSTSASPLMAAGPLFGRVRVSQFTEGRSDTIFSGVSMGSGALFGGIKKVIE